MQQSAEVTVGLSWVRLQPTLCSLVASILPQDLSKLEEPFSDPIFVLCGQRLPWRVLSALYFIPLLAGFISIVLPQH